jgi:hypothetical protein
MLYDDDASGVGGGDGNHDNQEQIYMFAWDHPILSLKYS